MAFKIAPKNEVKLKVIVRVLVDDDKIEKSELTVVYKRLPVSEYDDYVNRTINVTKQYHLSFSGKQEELEETLSELNREVLEKTVVDVYPLLDENDNEVEFTKERLDWLLEYQPTLTALKDGFDRLHNGRAEQEKNSKRRGGTGR